AYAGLISATGIGEDELHPLMMIEGPRLLFPFARAIMSDVTRDGGFLPLNLNPIDFVALYKDNRTKSDSSDQKTET
ncbi:MAG: protein-export chaperone SecB, partial [Pseudomonadota bacterium]|nr:protein-export chaperone SecB [Pseudomonadota bacterium]